MPQNLHNTILELLWVVTLTASNCNGRQVTKNLPMIPPSRSRPLVYAEKIAACSPMLHSVHKTVDKLFDRLKNLTGQFVHSKPYNIFTPLTLGTDEPGWTFVRGYTNCPCAEHYLIKYKMASFSLVPRASVTFVQRMGQWSPSLYKRIATSGNEIGPLLAEIPRIHATTPLQYKNRNGYGVHTAPVKFATLYWLKNWQRFWTFIFFNG